VSNIDPVDETVVETTIESPVTEAPEPDSGQAEGTGEATQEVSDFDVSQYSTEMVSVKVNGEDVRVPLSEALSGYQRQSDYTQKTQALAKASALSAALESNPEATLALLQQTYGKQAAQQLASAASPQGYDDGLDDDDPMTDQIRGMRAELQELRGIETNRSLDSTLAGLKAKYGDHFNEQELIQAATQRQIQTPAELESVFRDITFDKFFAVSQAQEQHASDQAAETVARQAAATAAAQAVSSGNGVAQTSAGAAPAIFDSFDDAFYAAAQAAGVQ
jgi:hypothetical protein